MFTSPYAYEHVLRAMRRKPTSLSKAGAGATTDRSKMAILGPLVWLYHLFIRLTFGVKADWRAADTAEWPQPRNRSQRLLDGYVKGHARFPVARRISSLFQRLMRGMTPGQRLEFEARMSGLGRIRIYGMRTRRSLARLRRPQMVRFAHGWWRMPSMSAVAGGHWEAQLPNP